MDSIDCQYPAIFLPVREDR